MPGAFVEDAEEEPELASPLPNEEPPDFFPTPPGETISPVGGRLIGV